LGEQRLSCGVALRRRPALSGYVGRTVLVGLRPEHVEDAAIALGAPPDQRLSAVVDLREALGSEILLFLSLDGAGLSRPALTSEDEPSGATGGDDEVFGGRAGFVARASAESAARPGDRIEVAVDVSKLHFFDAETGLAIYG
jgi:multiple sugar transport system ATP-binding protein